MYRYPYVTILTIVPEISTFWSPRRVTPTESRHRRHPSKPFHQPWSKPLESQSTTLCRKLEVRLPEKEIASLVLVKHNHPLETVGTFPNEVPNDKQTKSKKKIECRKEYVGGSFIFMEKINSQKFNSFDIIYVISIKTFFGS